MKNILTIMKKELTRVFKDPKLIFSVFILPGLIIFILYSLLGNAITGMVKSEEVNVYTENMPEVVSDAFNTLGEQSEIIITYFNNEEGLTIEEIKALVNDGTLDLAVYFTDEEINYYYKSTRISSYSALNLFTSSLTLFDDNKLVIDNIEYRLSHGEDLVTVEELENEASRQMTSILPMLIMTFLFTGALAFGPESIAGDKERGTIATLLATPTKRSEIALGKIFSLSILSILAGLSSFIGIILSLPKLMGGATNTAELAYGIGEYISILGLLASAVLLIISVVSIISAYSRTIKEATSYSSPFMILTMVIGISNLFMTGSPSITTAFIPLFNIVQGLNMILSFNFDITYFLITIGANLVVTVLLAFVLTMQFKSEKIMFSK